LLNYAVKEGCVLSGGPYLQTFTHVTTSNNDVIGRNEYLISTSSETTVL